MTSLRWNEVEGNIDVEEAEQSSSDGLPRPDCVFFFAVQLCSCGALFSVGRKIALKFWA